MSAIKTFLAALLLFCPAWILGQGNADFEEFLATFAEVPLSADLYAQENHGMLLNLHYRRPPFDTVPMVSAGQVRRFVCDDSLPYDSTHEYRSLSRFRCGENTVVIFWDYCLFCPGDFSLGTGQYWMISYSPEGRKIDGLVFAPDDDGNFFYGAFETPPPGSPFLALLRGKQFVIRWSDWNKEAQKQEYAGIVEYLSYGIRADGTIVREKEKERSATFVYNEDEFTMSVEKEW